VKLARTKYASDREGPICLLLDVRGNAREKNTLQVWSYSKGCIVKLPRYYKTGPNRGRPIIEIVSRDAVRWNAVSVPRWLARAEGLYGKPDLPPIVTNFCREATADVRTPQQKSDDAERELAQYLVDRENRYRVLPGQRRSSPRADARNGAISA
jgi:hypothetical protein